MIPETQVDAVAGALDALFRGRRDVYGTFSPEVSGKSDKQVKSPLTLDVWKRHVSGKTPVGVYPTVKFGDKYCCAWWCYDVDDEQSQDSARMVASQVIEAAGHFGVEIVPELSKGKGFHLWCFLDGLVDVWKARGVAKLILHQAGMEEFSGGKGTELKIFPKQDALSASQPYGNYVYAPLFQKYTAHGRMRFVHPATLVAYPDQIAALLAIKKTAVAAIDELVDTNNLRPTNVHPIGKQKEAKPTPVSTADAPGGLFARTQAGGVSALSDAEFDLLCSLLPTLRRAKHQPMMLGYESWLATLVHLVPFEDGLARAHQMSHLDSVRYTPAAVEQKWQEACKIYGNPDRAGAASISERIIIGVRQGAREDVIPISPKHGVWKGGFCTRTWVKNPLGSWIEATPMQLSNFVLTIDAQETLLSNDEPSKSIRMSGSMASGKPLASCAIPADSWQNIVRWLPKHWGSEPIIFSGGKSNSALVLECLALSSQDAELRDVYDHTGWIKAGESGSWAFLLPSGPCGIPPDLAASLSNNLSVTVPRELQAYKIPMSVTEDQAAEAYRWLAKLFYCGPPDITAALVGALFLAPISSLVTPGFGIYVSGQSKSRKSTLVAIALSFWGKFSKDSLPITFGSTEHAIMKMAATAKDLPLAIDNFVPGLDSNYKLMSLARAMGDVSGRGRMEKSTPPPRCLPIMTGEDLVRGESSAARLFTLTLMRKGPGSVDNEKMHEVELAGLEGLTQPAATHYLGWLSAQLEDKDFIDNLKRKHLMQARHAQEKTTDQGRLFEQSLWLQIALDLLAKSAPDSIQGTPALDWIEEAKGALMHRTVRESSALREEGLANRFMGMMFSLMACGQVIALDASGGEPEFAASQLGWRRVAESYSKLNIQAQTGIVWTKSDPKVRGHWFLMFNVESVLAAGNRWARPSSRIVESDRAVSMALMNAGLLIQRYGRISNREWVDGVSWHGVRCSGPKVLQFLDMDSTEEPPDDVSEGPDVKS